MLFSSQLPNGSHDFFQTFSISFEDYFIRNPQTTIALPFLTRNISAIGGVFPFSLWTFISFLLPFFLWTFIHFEFLPFFCFCTGILSMTSCFCFLTLLALTVSNSYLGFNLIFCIIFSILLTDKYKKPVSFKNNQQKHIVF